MREFWINVLVEIVATLVIALGGFVTYAYIYWKSRKKILHFFGIKSSKPNICVCVSALNIKPGGSVGIEPVVTGYVGTATTKLEYEGALSIQKVLKAQPFVLLPRTLQDWLGQKNIELRNVDIPIKLSPPESKTLDPEFNSNLIVLGTGVYNSLSHYYLKEYFARHTDLYPWHFYHEKNQQGQRVIGIRRRDLEDSPVTGRTNRIEPAFIQRIYDVDRKITVFVCAGLGSSATFGSARYLSENWRYLQRTFGDEEFGIGLLFYNQDPDKEFVNEPTVYYEGLLRRAN